MICNFTPMPRHPLIVLRIAQQNHSLPRQPGQLSSLERGLQKRLLCHQRLGVGILQLTRQFLGRVRWVGRTGDAAGPEESEVDAGDVDVVGGEEAQDVAFLPLELMDETAAEGEGFDFDVVEAV